MLMSEFFSVNQFYPLEKIMRKSTAAFSMLLFCSSLLLTATISTAIDTISTTQSIRDGESETLVSAGGIFELGFFSPGTSKNRYLGIWFKKINVTTVVWVANRESPLTDSLGVMKVTDGGVLILLNQTKSIIWSSNSSRSARNPFAKLLDSGNLIVIDDSDNENDFLWQSFDHPSDTFLPGMKIGRNRITGLDRYLSSWKSLNDPSQGDHTFGVDAAGFPQLVVRQGSVVEYRSGPWNGLRFSGTPQLNPNDIYKYNFVFDEKEIYYSFVLVNISIPSRLVVDQNGNLKRFIWVDQTHSWVLFLILLPIDNCDQYGLCGPHGSCTITNSPVCSCLKGFVPNFPNEWNMVDWSNGCVRKTPLNCSGDGFLRYSGLKLPDTRKAWFNKTMNLKECEMKCKKNCSCTAYANLDIREGGSGCLLWFGDLIDIRQFTENGQVIYIRMASSELDHGRNVKKKVKIIVGVVMSTGMLILGIALVLYIWRKKHQMVETVRHNPEVESTDKSPNEDLELPLFDLATIAYATHDFSISNKLGEGGFGSVFKGMLKDGKEIAVKRLSRNSRQGVNEFKNEVIHIAKLQHRNLVKLLGCCIEEDEKMLIYEFMPNKSLDFFIFDQTKSMLLDWSMRFQIINGIARGLLYLHQDSRLRIIHRDLKASNILLDSDMNPKISDFGLARSFGENEIEANTKKVVGTYGYMSPEYVIDGQYSVKSDIFSFGVIMLEIVSGKRNRGFHHPDHDLNLLGHAWRLYTENKSFELIDKSLRDSCNLSDVLRSIHVGLLCVQRNPEDRPSMSTVVLMLGSEGALVPPKVPGFFGERNLIESNSSTSYHKSYSANEFTSTTFEAR